MNTRWGRRSRWYAAAYVCVVDSRGRLLLGLRSRGWQTGTWCLPGGHLEDGEQPAGAAARELREETGIAVEAKTLLPMATFTTDYEGDQYAQFPFLLRDDGPAAAGDGLSAVRWVYRREVMDLNLHRTSSEVIHDLKWRDSTGWR